MLSNKEKQVRNLFSDEDDDEKLFEPTPTGNEILEQRKSARDGLIILSPTNSLDCRMFDTAQQRNSINEDILQ